MKNLRMCGNLHIGGIAEKLRDSRLRRYDRQPSRFKSRSRFKTTRLVKAFGDILNFSLDWKSASATFVASYLN